MSRLIRHWLNEDVQLTREVGDCLGREFHNGYLFGELLYRFNQQDDFGGFRDSERSQHMVDNFVRFERAVSRLGVKGFDASKALRMMEGDEKVCEALLYDVKMALSQITTKLGRHRDEGVMPGNLVALSNLPQHTVKPVFAAKKSAIFEQALRARITSQNKIDMDRHLQPFYDEKRRQGDAAAKMKQDDKEDLAMYYNEMRQRRILNKKADLEDLNAWHDKGIGIWTDNQRRRKYVIDIEKAHEQRTARQQQDRRVAASAASRNDALQGLEGMQARLKRLHAYNQVVKSASPSSSSSSSSASSLSLQREPGRRRAEKQDFAAVREFISDLKLRKGTAQGSQVRRECRRVRFLDGLRLRNEEVLEARRQKSLAGALAVQSRAEARLDAEVERLGRFEAVARKNRESRSALDEEQRLLDEARREEREAALEADADEDKRLAQEWLHEHLRRLRDSKQRAGDADLAALCADLVAGIVDVALAQVDHVVAAGGKAFALPEALREAVVSFAKPPAATLEAQELAAYCAGTHLWRWTQQQPQPSPEDCLRVGNFLAPARRREMQLRLQDKPPLKNKDKDDDTNVSADVPAEGSGSAETPTDVDDAAEVTAAVPGEAPTDVATEEEESVAAEGSAEGPAEGSAEATADATVEASEALASVRRFSLQVAIGGKPRSGKTVLAARLAAKFNLVILEPAAFLWRFLKKHPERKDEVALSGASDALYVEALVFELRELQLASEQAAARQQDTREEDAIARREDERGEEDDEEKGLMLRRLFDQWDEDESGEIDAMELLQAVARAQVTGKSPQQLLDETFEAFTQMDFDLNGLITWDEFQRYFAAVFGDDKACRGAVRALLRQTDAGRASIDGWVLDGFPATRAQARLLDLALSGLDADATEPAPAHAATLPADAPRAVDPAVFAELGAGALDAYVDVRASDAFVFRTAAARDVASNASYRSTATVAPAVARYEDCRDGLSDWYGRFGTFAAVDVDETADLLFADSERLFEEAAAPVAAALAAKQARAAREAAAREASEKARRCQAVCDEWAAAAQAPAFDYDADADVAFLEQRIGCTAPLSVHTLELAGVVASSVQLQDAADAAEAATLVDHLVGSVEDAAGAARAFRESDDGRLLGLATSWLAAVGELGEHAPSVAELVEVVAPAQEEKAEAEAEEGALELVGGVQAAGGTGAVAAGEGKGEGGEEGPEEVDDKDEDKAVAIVDDVSLLCAGLKRALIAATPAPVPAPAPATATATSTEDTAEAAPAAASISNVESAAELTPKASAEAPEADPDSGLADKVKEEADRLAPLVAKAVDFTAALFAAFRVEEDLRRKKAKPGASKAAAEEREAKVALVKADEAVQGAPAEHAGVDAAVARRALALIDAHDGDFVGGATEVFGAVRRLREQWVQRFACERAEVDSFLREDSNGTKQLLVAEFQRDFDEVADDMRQDPATKAELHHRVEDLAKSLWEQVQLRRDEGKYFVADLRAATWLRDEFLDTNVSELLRMFQLEATRYQGVRAGLQLLAFGEFASAEQEALCSTLWPVAAAFGPAPDKEVSFEDPAAKKGVPPPDEPPSVDFRIQVAFDAATLLLQRMQAASEIASQDKEKKKRGKEEEAEEGKEEGKEEEAEEEEAEGECARATRALDDAFRASLARLLSSATDTLAAFERRAREYWAAHEASMAERFDAEILAVEALVLHASTAVEDALQLSGSSLTLQGASFLLLPPAPLQVLPDVDPDTAPDAAKAEAEAEAEAEAKA